MEIKQSGESNGDAGDQYTGLDRFDRIVDQRWRKTSDGSHTDRFQYGYDRDGNRLYRDNLLNNDFDELYHANGASNGYDGLNQLAEFRRGALSDANSDNIPDTVTTASRYQTWDFDALGNFDAVNTDGTNQTRSHNKQNEITSISGATTPTYDANGNMIGDETGKTLVFDAWNQFVSYKNGSTVLVSNEYDALGRRVVEGPGTETDFYYSADWQTIEERISGAAKIQYIWSPAYVDALVLRDRDATGDSALEERLWVMHDANFNVSGLYNGSAVVQERSAQDPYGTFTLFDASWGSRSSSSFAWQHYHQGLRYNASIGAYDNRGRWYDADTGRFLWVDPLRFGAGDTNFYRYVGGRSVSNTDPLGLYTIKVTGGTLTVSTTKSGDELLPGAGISITFAGSEPVPMGFLKVKQYMQLEVYGEYRCRNKEKKCWEGGPTAILQPGIPLTRPHPGHTHTSQVPSEPAVQNDPGGPGAPFSPGPYENPMDPFGNPIRTSMAYIDPANAPYFILSNPKDRDKIRQLFPPVVESDGRICVLEMIRIVQRFITLVYINGVHVHTVHWTTTASWWVGFNQVNEPTAGIVGGLDPTDASPNEIIQKWWEGKSGRR